MLLLASIACLLALIVVSLQRGGWPAPRRVSRPAAGAAAPGPPSSAGPAPAAVGPAGAPPGAPAPAGTPAAGRARPAGSSAAPSGPPAPTAAAGSAPAASAVPAATAAPPPVAVVRAAASRPVPPEPAPLALVFDDAGHNLQDLRPYLELPIPFAVAVLPGLPHSTAAAEAVKAAGKDLLLHLPMEPLNGEDPGPGAVTTAHDAAAIRSLLERAMEEVPGVLGINNHMGSKATADARVMAEVMGYLGESGRLFLDSRTTAGSIAAPAAAAAGVPFLARDVFLDNGHTAGEVRRELARGVALARRAGGAVLIGHVTSPVSAEVLRGALAGLQREGVRFIHLQDLLRDGTDN